MPKITAIKRNRDFLGAYRRGKRINTKLFAIYYKRNRTNERRLGVTVSKKIGNAVTRNRTRRIIKEAYKEIQSEIKYGWDIVIVAYNGAAESKTYEIEKILREKLPAELLERQ